MRSEAAKSSIVLPVLLLAGLVIFAAVLWFVGPFVTIGGLAPFEMIATRFLFILSFSVPMLILIFVIWRQRRPRKTTAGRRAFWRFSAGLLIGLAVVVLAVFLWDGGATGFDTGHVLIAFGVLAIVWAATWYYESSGTRRAAVLYGALIAVGAMIGANILISYQNNLALIERSQTDIEAYQIAAVEVPIGPVSDVDFLVIAPALKILRNMPGTGVFGQSRPALANTWGLNQSGAIGGQTARTYRAALNRMLLPRMLIRLEEDLQTNINNPTRLFETLKVYLMLGLQGPMDRNAVFQWMTDDWTGLYGQNDTVVSELLDHLDALTSQPMESIALNGPLVEQAQDVLLSSPRALLLYRAILTRPEVRELPDFQLTEHAGPNASRLLVRRSGKTLDDGIEGVFTRIGFHEVFLPEVVRTVLHQQNDDWVLGAGFQSSMDEAGEAVLIQNILEYYYNDYQRRYSDLLSDIDVVPITSLSHASDVLAGLSGSVSPTEATLKAVSAETQLGDFQPDDSAGLTIANKKLSRLQTLAKFNTLRRASPDTLPDDAGQPVQEKFSWLHNLTHSEDGRPSVLDGVMQRLLGLSDDLRNATAFGDTRKRADVANALTDMGERLPDPLGRWTLHVSGSFEDVVAIDTRRALDEAWKSSALPFCERTTKGRYPFIKESGLDTPLQDFGDLFGQLGVIHGFFDENLAQHVDTSKSPWRWTAKGAALGISQAVLTEFERAKEIREAFFSKGTTTAVSFKLRPKALDARAFVVRLEIQGKTLSYSHGPILWTSFSWPGEARSAVTISPPEAGRRNGIAFEGAWSWLRLLDTVEVQTGDVGEETLIFNLGGRLATFEMRTDGPYPFLLSALREFSCPPSL